MVITLAIILFLLIFTSLVSSCSVMLEGMLGGVGASTYQSEEEDMLEAEEAYRAMEEELQYTLDNYELLYPGYDEYRITGEVSGHDPYVLTSILSAMYENTPQKMCMTHLREYSPCNIGLKNEYAEVSVRLSSP